MKTKINGYYWTIYDLLLVIIITIFLSWVAYTVLSEHGISVNTLAGTIWGVGTLGFLFIYQLPLFGNSVEAKTILDKNNEILSKEEVKVVMSDKRYTKIPNHVLKIFLIFFIISGGITIYGALTNT